MLTLYLNEFSARLSLNKYIRLTLFHKNYNKLNIKRPAIKHASQDGFYKSYQQESTQFAPIHQVPQKKDGTNITTQQIQYLFKLKQVIHLVDPVHKQPIKRYSM